MKTYPQKHYPEKAPKPAPPAPPKPTGLWVPTPEGCLSDTDPLSGIHWLITVWGPRVCSCIRTALCTTPGGTFHSAKSTSPWN